MSLQLKISAHELKNSFVVNECTGKYSSSNPGGWGNQNPEISTATKAYLEILAPDAANPIMVDVFGVFPTTDTDLGYEITPSMVNQTHIVSGAWKITYFVEGVDKNGVAYKKKAFAVVVFVNSARCCVDKMLKNVSVNAFKDKKQKIAVELSALLDVVDRNKKCFPADCNEILKFINLQCACCGCS